MTQGNTGESNGGIPRFVYPVLRVDQFQSKTAGRVEKFERFLS